MEVAAVVLALVLVVVVELGVDFALVLELALAVVRLNSQLPEVLVLVFQTLKIKLHLVLNTRFVFRN